MTGERLMKVEESREQLRSNFLTVLQNAIGQGETTANNAGPFVKEVLESAGIKHASAWCAPLMVWAIKKALYEMGAPIHIGASPFWRFGKLDEGYRLCKVEDIFTPSAKETFNNFKKLGWLVDEPQPGDLIFFWRVDPKAWQGHIGVVEEVVPKKIESGPGIRSITEKIVNVIEGNVGKFPAKVRQYPYQEPIDKLLGYGRLFGGQ